MRPKANYQLVLYCNPNLKSNVSGKDKKFTEDFQKSCGNIPVEFLSELPTLEKLTSIPTTEDSRAFVICDDFMDATFKSPVIQQLFGRMGTHNYLGTIQTLHNHDFSILDPPCPIMMQSFELLH